MVDHLQFGNPEDPEIFWTFLESLKGLTDFAKEFKIPCVGGKVSFYNETPKGPIKPTPLIGVLGLIEKKTPQPQKIAENDVLVIIGDTKNELGGSEYYEFIHSFIGGKCPQVNFKSSQQNMQFVLDIIKKNLIKQAHDCSKGGLAIAISELCIWNNIGCRVSMNKIPSEKIPDDRILFSESHSRYLLVLDQKNLKELESKLSKTKIPFGIIGKFKGDQIVFEKNKPLANLRVDKAQKTWMNSLKEIILHA